MAVVVQLNGDEKEKKRGTALYYSDTDTELKPPFPPPEALLLLSMKGTRTAAAAQV